jgi:hypothetical protein
LRQKGCAKGGLYLIDIIKRVWPSKEIHMNNDHKGFLTQI